MDKFELTYAMFENDDIIGFVYNTQKGFFVSIENNFDRTKNILFMDVFTGILCNNEDTQKIKKILKINQ